MRLLNLTALITKLDQTKRKKTTSRAWLHESTHFIFLAVGFLLGVRLLGLSLGFSIMALSVFPFLSSSRSASILSAGCIPEPAVCGWSLSMCSLWGWSLSSIALSACSVSVLFCSSRSRSGVSSALSGLLSVWSGCGLSRPRSCLWSLWECPRSSWPPSRPNLSGWSESGWRLLSLSESELSMSKWSSSGRSVLSLLSFLAGGGAAYCWATCCATSWEFILGFLEQKTSPEIKCFVNNTDANL